MNQPPFLAAISFSAGTGSSGLLWMLLRGKIERPKRIFVQAADPGMENTFTYAYRDMLFQELVKANIPHAIAPGPNLYQDIVTLKERDATRLDNPPYFTASDKGKRGQLQQKCTKYYKISVLNRHLRKHLRQDWHIKRLRPGLIERWIGFTYDERHRIKEPKEQYVSMRYPLVEMEITKSALLAWYAENNIPPPPIRVQCLLRQQRPVLPRHGTGPPHRLRPSLPRGRGST